MAELLVTLSAGVWVAGMVTEEVALTGLVMVLASGGVPVAVPVLVIEPACHVGLPSWCRWRQGGRLSQDQVAEQAGGRAPVGD